MREVGEKQRLDTETEHVLLAASNLPALVAAADCRLEGGGGKDSAIGSEKWTIKKLRLTTITTHRQALDAKSLTAVSGHAFPVNCPAPPSDDQRDRSQNQRLAGK